MLGVTGDTPDFDAEDGKGACSSRVQAVCDFYGPSDFLQMDSRMGSFSHDAPQSAESRLVRGPIQKYKELVEKTNPLNYLEGKTPPPFLIVHDRGDMYVPFHQSELLYEALRKSGGDATLCVAHESEYPFHGFDDSGESRSEIRSAVDAFFAKYLKTTGQS